MEAIMRKTLLISAAVLGLAAVPAFAQDASQSVTGARPGNTPGTNNSLPLGNTASNIAPNDTRSPIAPHLPTPQAGEDGSIAQYLASAQRAVKAKHTGEAQQALEMAETRALDRSTLASQANVPDSSPLVKQIQQALDSLSKRDMTGTDQAISQAMTMVGNSVAATGTTKM
jgi:hypothetical protein